ncbi:hypothetical protein E1293_25655 [Actinomadura darangshiensis]|uniref:Uncharacterized protein n=1 Tax=Actinomadura darangshiensis TaxID=705336 RepID=A0A4R5B104_9ACTN|nr:hypothetical protein [Actinomadura darangshiensis]TDD77826.1 hypothetical protein E1293_25655 [Actinomadura darangshiensis]
MSAEPIGPAPRTTGPDEYEVIHLGGEAAAVVPLDDYRRLKALEQAATPEALDAAEAAARSAAMDEWEAAGRPGAVSHEEFMAEILGSGV